MSDEPIYLGHESQDALSVAHRLARVPILSELTARLGALPSEALKAAVSSEPDIYRGTITEARDTAAYLRLIADSFSKLADRLQTVAGPAQ